MRVPLAEILCSWLIGTIIASFFFPVGGHPSWHSESSAVRRVARQLTERCAYEANARLRAAPERLQQWLIDGLEPEGAFLPKPAGTDTWGNHYRLALHDSDSSEMDQVRIYSLGEDGKTATDGNDPDDINSWTDSNTQFYDQRQAYRLIWATLALGVLCGVVVWLILFRVLYGLLLNWNLPTTADRVDR